MSQSDGLDVIRDLELRCIGPGGHRKRTYHYGVCRRCGWTSARRTRADRVERDFRDHHCAPGMRWVDRRWKDEATRIGAAELVRLKDARIGADHQNPGKYAVYFFDADDQVVRSAGRFATPREADEAIPLIRAEAVLEEVSAAGWSA